MSKTETRPGYRSAGPVTLFEGSARAGVPHFPANVNIAAALAMAGIGFDRTQLKVMADPALVYNTHYINIRGRTGTISIKFEACHSRQPQDRHARLLQRARLRSSNSIRRLRYGT